MHTANSFTILTWQAWLIRTEGGRTHSVYCLSLVVCSFLFPVCLFLLIWPVHLLLLLLSPRAHLHVVGMLRFMSDINQPSLPTPFCSVLVSVCVYVALSTVFHSINFPNNSPLSHSVLPVLFLPNWSFQLYIYSWKSLSALIWSFVVDWV